MSILDKYINPIYLTKEGKDRIKEDLKSKPNVPYVVLDNFFLEETLELIQQEHDKASFDPTADSRSEKFKDIKFPFDGAVAQCDPDSTLGEFLYSREWYKYCFDILDMEPIRVWPTIKIRYNKEDANGYWLHNDKPGGPLGFERIITILGYFNKDWKTEDGGLLQIWQESPIKDPKTPSYNEEEFLDQPLTFLEQPRINVWPYGATWDEHEGRDFILVDQILPVYNRLVIFNLNTDALYHSVTPNYGKRRDGFIEWLSKCV